MAKRKMKETETLAETLAYKPYDPSNLYIWSDFPQDAYFGPKGQNTSGLPTWIFRAGIWCGCCWTKTLAKPKSRITRRCWSGWKRTFGVWASTSTEGSAGRCMRFCVSGLFTQAQTWRSSTTGWATPPASSRTRTGSASIGPTTPRPTPSASTNPNTS